MRGLAYIFGILLLVDAIPAIFNPQFWVQFTQRNLAGSLPDPVTTTITDFGRLSDNAVRTKALTQIFAGLMLVFLASLVPVRHFGMWGGGRMMKMHRHPMMHTHEHAHEGQGAHTHEHAHGGEGEQTRQERI